MPFRIEYNEEKGAVEVWASLTPEQLPEFRNALDAEFRRFPGVPNNWQPLFMAIIAHMRANSGEEKITAIKLWRLISRAGLKDAKDYVEGVAAGTIPEPTGLEYPGVKPDPEIQTGGVDWQWFERQHRRFVGPLAR